MAKMKKKPTVAELLNKNKDKSCGDCVFFVDNGTKWNGICELRRTPLTKNHNDRACAWFKERKQ